MASAAQEQTVPEALVRKIGALPRARVTEVEDFVDFLSQRERDTAAERSLRDAVREGSAPALAAIWSNPDDDVYDGH